MTSAIRLGLAVVFVVLAASTMPEGPTARMKAVAMPPAAQTARMKQVMRVKLDHSQRILEAVVTSNWSQLDRESREMAAIVRDPAWSALAMPEYIRHSEAFLRAIDDLLQAAKMRDLEGATLGFVSLTTSCVNCHRYLARARIAAAP